MNRRGFLKLAGAAAAAVTALKVLPSGVIVYDEVPVSEAYTDWITDKGDWIEVVVPSGKTLRKENFDKPILLMMGEGAVFDSCAVLGFVNLYGKGNTTFANNLVDATGKEMAGKRPLVHVKQGKNLNIISCHLRNAKSDPFMPINAAAAENTMMFGPIEWPTHL